MKPELDIRPTGQGTIVILVSCLIAYFFSFMEAQPSRVAQIVAVCLLAGISISFLLDWRLGIRNLLRVDVFAFLALYFLSYFEFLFPQGHFDVLVNPDDVLPGIHVTLIGFAALAVGRHIRLGSGNHLAFVGKINLHRRYIVLIYFAAFFFSHLHMWVAVDFNPVVWIDELMGPRFARAWGRGKFGNLSSLFYELILLSYVMPPIAGLIYARWREYGKTTAILITIPLLLLLFGGFTGGTRNVLAIHLAGLLAGFFVVQKRIRIWAIALVGGVTAICFFFLAEAMVEFRNMGFKTYVEEGMYRSDYKEFVDTTIGESSDGSSRGYFVDYNLWRITQLVGSIPEVYPYVGWNLPYVALTKPIPRAFWPGKPTDLAVSLEEVVGAEGYTIACTWIGEAYLAGGAFWILCVGLLIGVFCRFWNQLANYISSPFALIVFASGFFAVLLLMRSLMFFTTALLPSIALIVMGFIIFKHQAKAEGHG